MSVTNLLAIKEEEEISKLREMLYSKEIFRIKKCHYVRTLVLGTRTSRIQETEISSNFLYVIPVLHYIYTITERKILPFQKLYYYCHSAALEPSKARFPSLHQKPTCSAWFSTGQNQLPEKNSILRIVTLATWNQWIFDTWLKHWFFLNRNLNWINQWCKRHYSLAKE